MEIDLETVPSREDLADTRTLYSESAGRFIVTVDPAKEDAFKEVFKGANIGKIGRVTESTLFRIRGKDRDLLMEEEILQLKDGWKRPFGGLI
jgi:phosphoribosylformylglycinamidine synthase